MPDLDKITWAECTVRFYPDSDTWQRPDLLKAIYAFCRELESRGATMAVVMLPQNGSEKMGVDDYLQSGRTFADLQKLPTTTTKGPEFDGLEGWHVQWKNNREGQNSCQNSMLDTIESDLSRIESVPEEWVPKPADKLSTEIKPVSWKLEGFIAEGYITELVGFLKTGKTTFVNHLLKGTSEGGELAGFGVSPSKVLIISEEVEREWCERANKYDLRDNVHVISLPFKTKPTSNVWHEFLQYLDKLILKEHYDLIVFDTLSNLWCVIDENNNSETVSALMPLRAWTQAHGVAILLVHHSSKNDGTEGRASRGASSLPAFVDIITEFRRKDPSRVDDCRRVLKSYSRRPETPLEIIIELADEKYTLLGDLKEVSEAERLNIILKVLTTINTKFTAETVRDAWPNGLTPSKKTLQRNLEKLFSQGKIDRCGSGVKGSPYEYFHKNSIRDNPPPIGGESNIDTNGAQEAISVDVLEVVE